jgi:hypothetical protein
VVAALVAVVGCLIGEGVLDFAMVRPQVLIGSDTMAFATRYALTSALAALVATGLAHLLVLSTPRPREFFTWIVLLATAVTVAAPFAVEGTTEGKIATAVVNLVIGLCILTLTLSVVSRTVRFDADPAAPGAPPYTPPAAPTI